MQSLPKSKCVCNKYDWTWNVNKNIWECSFCMQELIEKPVLNPADAQRWCQTMFDQYDNTLKELEELEAEEGVTLIHLAKVKRAEKALDRQDKLAETASAVQQIMAATPKGSVSINLPEVDLMINLEWSK